ncbi:MAG: hypothetical protein ACHQEB_01090 [Chitinophagales bacterium]
MTSKPDKEKKSAGKTNTPSGKDAEKKISAKSKKQEEEDDDDPEEEDEIEVTPSSKKGAKAVSPSKKGKADNDDDDEADDVVDDWDKVEEEEEWDPDFEEFDLPKSKGKKGGATPGAAKKGFDEEEDFKIDDEFKDMGLFNDNSFDEEEEDF